MLKYTRAKGKCKQKVILRWKPFRSTFLFVCARDKGKSVWENGNCAYFLCGHVLLLRCRVCVCAMRFWVTTFRKTICGFSHNIYDRFKLKCSTFINILYENIYNKKLGNEFEPKNVQITEAQQMKSTKKDFGFNFPQHIRNVNSVALF